MRWMLIAGLGLTLLTGCVSQASFGDAITQGEPSAIPTPIVPVKPVYQVERGDILYERRFYGRILPVVARDAAFSIAGRAEAVQVEIGAEVNEGDILARLDTSTLENQLLEAEEELAVAQSILDSAESHASIAGRRAEIALEMAQLRLDHALANAPDPPDSDQQLIVSLLRLEVDLARIGVDELSAGIDPQLRFDVRRAQKSVDDLREAIASAKLISPLTGHLISLSIDVGDLAAAFEPVAVVADLSALEVTDELNPADLSELSEGMPATIQRAVRPGTAYAGFIRRLPQPYGLAADGFVHIAFADQPPQDEFAVGDRMVYTVVIEKREDVLWLPVSAIRQFSGRNFIVVQDEGLQRRVDVRLGLSGNGRVEILEGAEEHQTVIGP